MKTQMYTPDHGYVKTNAVSIFLGGPINGALEWRDKFMTHFQEKYSEFDERIAFLNPQRKEAFKKSTDINQNEYQWQVVWEAYHLNSADIILFIIPEKEFEIENYARTTRFELGEWMAKNNILSTHPNIQDSDLNFPHILICIDDSFAGKRYINNKVDSSQLNSKIQSFESLSQLESRLFGIVQQISRQKHAGTLNIPNNNLSDFIGKSN